jgi:catechol 2,3-dioxygenase-like lactoylglutathione lyase family enzyme
MQFSNVRLVTGDFDASYRFWRDVMGLTVAVGPDSPGAVPSYAYLTVGDVGVELMRPDDFAAALGAPSPAAVPSSLEAVLVLGVDDVDTAYAELVGKGARSVAGPVDRPLWGAHGAHRRSRRPSDRDLHAAPALSVNADIELGADRAGGHPDQLGRGWPGIGQRRAAR